MKKIFYLIFIFFTGCYVEKPIKVEKSLNDFLPPHQEYNRYELHQKFANTLAYKTVNIKALQVANGKEYHKLVRSDFEKLKKEFFFNEKEKVKQYYKLIYYAIELEEWKEAKKYYRCIRNKQNKEYDFGVEWKTDSKFHQLKFLIGDEEKINQTLEFQKFFMNTQVNEVKNRIGNKYYTNLIDYCMLQSDYQKAVSFMDLLIKRYEKETSQKKWLYADILMTKLKKAELYNIKYEILKKQRLFSSFNIQSFYEISQKDTLDYYNSFQEYTNDLKSQFSDNATYLLFSSRVNKFLSYYKGNISLTNKNYEQSIKEYSKALEIVGFFSPTKDRLLSDIKSSLALAYTYNKQYQKAIPLYEISLEDKGASNANYYGGAIRNLHSIENYEASLKKPYQSNFLQSQYGKESISLSELNLFLAKTYLAMNKNEKAYDYILEAYEIFFGNKFSTFFILDNMKSDYMEQRSLYSSLLFNYTPIQSDFYIQQTFNKLLNFKRSVYDNESSLRILKGKTISQTFKDKIDDFFRLQRTLARQYQKVTSIDIINNTTRKLTQVSTFLSLSIPKFKKISNQEDITFQTLVNELNTSELYIDFASIGNDYYIFTLDHKKNITFKKIKQKDTEIIHQAIASIHKDTDVNLRDLDTAQIEYSKLYNLIIQPLQNELKGKDTLIISPDGLLNTVPFEAFYDSTKEEFLIQNYCIKYTPSGKEYIKSKQNDAIVNQDTVIFANSDFNSTRIEKNRGNILKQLKAFPNLQYALDEAKSVKSTFKEAPQTFFEEKATEESFMTVKRPKFWHIITHGFYIPDANSSNPLLNSGIVLHGANESIRNEEGNSTGDGIITGLELAGMDLKGTDLVVLSACLTGSGDIENSEGVASVSKAFRLAGAKYLITSLWSIDDEFTSIFMEKLYTKINSKYSYSRALQETKKEMIKINSHPFYWAGFVGSGRD